MSDAGDCLAEWCADTDWCAVTCAADVLSNKWHPAVVAALLADGPLGFSALRNRVDGVSKPVLSDALEALTEDGVVERRVVSESPYRVEYALTDAGRDLEAVVRALREWGESYASAEGC